MKSRNDIEEKVGVVYATIFVILMFPLFFGAFFAIMLIEYLEKERKMTINKDLQVLITWIGVFAGYFLFYWITGFQPTPMGDDH